MEGGGSLHVVLHRRSSTEGDNGSAVVEYMLGLISADKNRPT